MAKLTLRLAAMMDRADVWKCPTQSSEVRSHLNQPKPARLDNLTILRFVAAFVVFAFHALGFLRGSTRTIGEHIFSDGRSGVTFFFILSGFVLAWSSESGDSPKRFYRRRMARLYPAYLVALVFAAGMIFLRTPQNLIQGIPTLLLVQAWIPSSTYYFALNVPAWSLSCEAFFYLTFGPLVRRLFLLFPQIPANFTLPGSSHVHHIRRHRKQLCLRESASRQQLLGMAFPLLSAFPDTGILFRCSPSRVDASRLASPVELPCGVSNKCGGVPGG